MSPYIQLRARLYATVPPVNLHIHKSFLLNKIFMSLNITFETDNRLKTIFEN